LSRTLLCALLFGISAFGNLAHAQENFAELGTAAVQRLNWAGLYLPQIEIRIGRDRVATLSGTVASDVVKAEVVETLQMTEGIHGVIDRLVVKR
jgi:hypothetical protein